MGKNSEASLSLTLEKEDWNCWKWCEKIGMENESVYRSLKHKYVEILEDEMLEQKDL